MFRPSKDQEKPAQPTGGLGGLGHVDRKIPTPRPAPRELLNGSKPPEINTSPYAQTNNTSPNFQTPTMQRPPATNIAAQVPTNLGGYGNEHIAASRKSWMPKPSMKQAFWLIGISTAVIGGFMYTRDKDPDELFADEAMED